MLVASTAAAQSSGKWAVVIHGGAGGLNRSSLDSSQAMQYRNGLEQALAAARVILDRGGSALDAVEQTIRLLEENPDFNSGRGAVFTADGRNELDASIMDGATLKAGAVAGITRTRHPISLARAVMDKSRHVMLIGEGAETFARSQGLEEVPPSFFFTERRWQDLIDQLTKENRPLPQRPRGAPPAPAERVASIEDRKFGTVGIVALDRAGNLAAGTSTGGVQAKQWGRVGDSPIIGAGTYANGSCAVSGTGVGEYFIRLTVAREICALVEHRGLELQAAADEVVHNQLPKLEKESGGIIAAGKNGQLVWSFNTSAMFRARQSEGGAVQISIFKDEP